MISRGRTLRTDTLSKGATVAIPPGHRRPMADRRAAFDVATYDRLRVLTTELRRLATEHRPLRLRLRPTAELSEHAIGNLMRWI